MFLETPPRCVASAGSRLSLRAPATLAIEPPRVSTREMRATAPR